MVEINFEYDGRTYKYDTAEELKRIFLETYIRGNTPITAAVAREYVEHIKHFSTAFYKTEEVEIINKLTRLFNEKSPEYPELLKILHAYRVFRLYLMDSKEKLQLFDIALKDTDPKHVKKHIAILNAISFVIDAELYPEYAAHTDEMDVYMNLAEQRPEFLPVLSKKLDHLSIYRLKQLKKNLDKYYAKYPKHVAPLVREWHQMREQLKQMDTKAAQFKDAKKKFIDNFNQSVAQRAAQTNRSDNR